MDCRHRLDDGRRFLVAASYGPTLRVSAEETVRRVHRRDVELFGSAGELERRYQRRYLPGQVI